MTLSQILSQIIQLFVLEQHCQLEPKSSLILTVSGCLHGNIFWDLLLNLLLGFQTPLLLQNYSTTVQCSEVGLEIQTTLEGGVNSPLCTVQDREFTPQDYICQLFYTVLFYILFFALVDHHDSDIMLKSLCSPAPSCKEGREVLYIFIFIYLSFYKAAIC